jgi:hypothetical protein
MPEDKKLPQQHGKILRDADGEVVGIEMLGASSEGEGDESGDEDNLANAGGVNERDTRRNTDVVNGTPHIVWHSGYY